MLFRAFHYLAAVALLTLILIGCSESNETKAQTDTTASAAENAAPATNAIPVSDQKGGENLDGRKFLVYGSEAGKPEKEPDTLIFSNGTFRSTTCDQYGFAEATYATVENGGSTSFFVTTESPTEGKIEWTGTLIKDSLEGGFRWTKDGQKPIDYVYGGRTL